MEVQSYFPQTQGGANSVGATNFSSPSTNLAGLSYSFDYDNARFMLLDQFTPTDGKASDGSTYSQGNNAIASQQPWISSTLSSKPANTHAFVFSHKQLFGGNHTDTLFNTAASNAAAQNAFIGSLDAGNVGYLFTGHDHMHNLSVVTSPDGTSQVHQVICASDSYKFYTPVALSNHGIDAVKVTQCRPDLQEPRTGDLPGTLEYWLLHRYRRRSARDRGLLLGRPQPRTPRRWRTWTCLTTPNLTFYKRRPLATASTAENSSWPQATAMC